MHVRYRPTLPLLVLLLIVSAGCDKIRWKAPEPKPVEKTAIEEGHRFPVGSRMAGPWLLRGPGGRLTVRIEVAGEGCAGAALARLEDGDGGRVLTGPGDGDGGRVEAVPAPFQGDDGRLQGTICEFPLPPLPGCGTFRYRIRPFDGPEGAHEAHVPPAPGDRCALPLVLSVLGDTRTGHSVHRQVAAAALAEGPSLIVNLGDIVQLNQRIHEWYQFFELETALLATAPLVLVPGNHETWWEPELGAQMLNRFFRLGERGGTGHHSQDVGALHLVFLDLYWGEEMDGSGRDWLEADLASVPGDRAILVFLHEPAISFGAHRPREVVKGLMPLFDRFDVAAVIAGHAHLYEHFVVDGIHYVTAGGGGAGLHPADLHVNEDQRQHLVKSSSEHHHLLITLQGKRLRFEARALDGATFDRWELPLPQGD